MAEPCRGGGGVHVDRWEVFHEESRARAGAGRAKESSVWEMKWLRRDTRH